MKSRTPLTVVARELVAGSCRLVESELARARANAVRRVGRPDLRQECWLAVCIAAADFDSNRLVPFSAFARLYVRNHLMSLGIPRGKDRFWDEWPIDRDSGRCADCPGFRSDGCDPLLRAWCCEENRNKRSGLCWRQRLHLYLRYVELWTAADIGRTLGVSKFCAQDIINRGLDELSSLTKGAS